MNRRIERERMDVVSKTRRCEEVKEENYFKYGSLRQDGLKVIQVN